VSLRRPVPLDADAAAGGDVTPASFNAGGFGSASASVRAKPYDGPALPMPVGTPGPGPKQSDKGEKITTPPTPGAPPTNIWDGNAVSQWVDNGGPVPDGAVIGGGPDGGPACGPDGGACCAPGGGLLSSFGGRLRGLFSSKSACGAACCDADTCCDAGPCRDAGPCGWDCCPSSCCSVWRFWGRAEYLLWTIKRGNTPVLVSGSPAGTPQTTAGVLGQPTTLPLYGGDIHNNLLSGGRFTLGVGVPGVDGLGFEGTYFFLGQRATHFVAGSNGTPILARPVTDVTTGTPVSQLVAFPGVVNGSVAVNSDSRLWGFEGNLRCCLCSGCNGFLHLLGGFRYLELDEGLFIGENLTQLSTGTNIILNDSFTTKNQFYGGQLGLDGEYRFKRWYVGGTVKLAMGVMHERLNINGSTVFLVPGVAPSVQTGGLLALPTNIGSYHNNQFAVVPEVGLRIGYQVTDHLRVFVGYNFLYASSVVRPGDQVNPLVNRSQIPTAIGASPLAGAPAPFPLFRHTDFWAQGVMFGVEFRY
jgi:hypothetical protein